MKELDSTDWGVIQTFAITHPSRDNRGSRKVAAVRRRSCRILPSLLQSDGSASLSSRLRTSEKIMWCTYTDDLGICGLVVI